MNDASAAVPTISTSAVRTPATMTRNANGSSTRIRVERADIPIPRAASTRRVSTPSRPITVLATMGSAP
ncbi:Uncharacterised protein [Mycobacteroides abscessus subsp. abscessus]|nr:Uncharacterised protein [Mycobacteroides abscessus subsp. abscessus]